MTLSVVLGLACACGCTTWSSIHGGYGQTLASSRSVAGVEVRRAVGGELHSPYGLVGARLDASADQFDGEIHVGAMRPAWLSNRFTFVPSFTVELLRLTRMERQWLGGAFGPGAGAELVWWYRIAREDFVRSSRFGCMGGAIGWDCPAACVGQDVTRQGIGFRVAAEYDMRLDSSYPRHNDWITWITVGLSRTVSEAEHECCYYHEPLHPTRNECQ